MSTATCDYTPYDRLAPPDSPVPWHLHSRWSLPVGEDRYLVDQYRSSARRYAKLSSQRLHSYFYKSNPRRLVVCFTALPLNPRRKGRAFR